MSDFVEIETIAAETSPKIKIESPIIVCFFYCLLNCLQNILKES
jgi:hypothetical protein